MAAIDLTVAVDPRNYQPPVWAERFSDIQNASSITQSPEPHNYQVPLWADNNFSDIQSASAITESLEPRNYQPPVWAEGMVDQTGLTQWSAQEEQKGGPFLDIVSSYPYPGSENIDINTSIVLPTGYWYTEAPTRTLLFRNIGALGGGATVGVDDSRTLIRVDYGEGYEVVYTFGAPQSGWSVFSSVSDIYGYFYEIYKTLPYASTVFVEITLYDFYGRRYRSVFSFQTAAEAGFKPLLININPPIDAVNVKPTAYVSFEIDTTHIPLDEETVVIEVDRGDGDFETAYNGANNGFQEGWTGLLSQKSVAAGVHKFVLDTTGLFVPSREVHIRVTALDVEGNEIDFPE